MSDSGAARFRRIFAYVSFAICALVALRPVPDVADSNDTGRYVADQEDACSAPLSDDDAGIQQWTLDLLVRPICWAKGPRLFLFVVSMAMPIAFIAFGEWRTEGALLLAAGVFLSVFGFELETNALRQAVSLAFLIAAVSLDNKLARWIAILMAVLLHTSSWIFLPWALFVNRKEPMSRRPTPYVRLLAIPLGLAIWVIFSGQFVTQFVTRLVDGIGLLEVYRAIYSVEVRRAFLIFMVLPVFWVFAVRLATTSLPMPKSEKFTFYYSALVLVLTIIFFPMITYRVAMTAAVLQLFVAMKAMDLSTRSAAWISAGLAGHLLIYTVLSPNVLAVLNG